MVLDKLKLSSRESYFTEEHIAFLLDKYRPFLLKQRYADIRKTIPQNNYSRFLIDIIEENGIDIDYIKYPEKYTVSGHSYSSIEPLPSMVSLNNATEEYKLYSIRQSETPASMFMGDYSIVTSDRFKFVGENKWLKNLAYATIGPDNKLYIKIADKTKKIPDQLLVQAIIENPKKAKDIIFPIKDSYLDMPYPLEEAIVPSLLDLVTQDLQKDMYRPEDTINDDRDNLPEVGENIMQAQMYGRRYAPTQQQIQQPQQ